MSAIDREKLLDHLKQFNAEHPGHTYDRVYILELIQQMRFDLPPQEVREWKDDEVVGDIEFPQRVQYHEPVKFKDLSPEVQAALRQTSGELKKDWRKVGITPMEVWSRIERVVKSDDDPPGFESLIGDVEFILEGGNPT